MVLNEFLLALVSAAAVAIATYVSKALRPVAQQAKATAALLERHLAATEPMAERLIATETAVEYLRTGQAEVLAELRAIRSELGHLRFDAPRPRLDRSGAPAAGVLASRVR
jgi:hypothetical protein